jgi:hypothetical protein
METPLVTLGIDQAAGEVQNNPFGYERIHIWYFNYDGKGSALVTFDDATDFESLAAIDLDHVLHGDPGSGVRWYHPVPLRPTPGRN